MPTKSHLELSLQVATQV